jgi:hypothetical protein
LVRFSIFHRVSVERPMCFATLRPLNFSKEKKGKKRKPFVQVEGFKKVSFFDKILPDISSEVWA